MTHTCLGTSLWDWQPWIELELPSRMLWLAFYTSAEAKRILPGLWHGGVSMMAEAARLDGLQTATALQDLMDRDMFEYDKKSRVGRITAQDGFNAFPDTAEFPTNGNTIRGWYRRFLGVPDVAIRNAHVTTLNWLITQGCSDHGQRKGRAPSHDHAKAWGETFELVQIPSQRRRGTRRVLDEDTSNSAQASLFGLFESHPVKPREEQVAPMIPPTLEPLPKGRAEAEAKADVISSGPEPEGRRDLDLPLPPPAPATPAPTADARPRLALVPHPVDGPFSVDDLVAVFGRTNLPLPPQLRERLAGAIRELRACAVGPPDLALLSELVARGGMPEVMSGTQRYVGWERVRVMVDHRRLLEAIDQARERRARVDDQRKMLAEIRQKVGV